MLNFAPEPFKLTHGKRIVGPSYCAADYDPSLFGEYAQDIRKVDMCNDLASMNEEQYEVVVHNHVLEHVPCDPGQVIQDLNRLLVPGGWHIFSIPILKGRKTSEDLSPDLSKEDRIRRFGQEDHMRVFGHDFDTIFQAAGILDTLFDVSSLVTEEELETWGIPVEALRGSSSHRIFAWHKE